MNIYQKLQDARLKLQATSLKKSGHNKFAGYQYFELGDFLPTVQTIFGEVGLCPHVSFTKDFADLRIINTEKPEEVITFTSPMAEANLKGTHPIQNLGAVETYQRRYLYMMAMEIVEHDALDASKPLDKTITPIKAAMQSVVVNDEDMQFLQGLAAELVQAVEIDGAIVDAYDLMESQKLDNDQKLALWNYLQPNSRTRSALKKEGESRRKAA